MIEPVFMRATRQGANFMVVLVGLVIIFKSQITQIINSLFQKITSQTGTV